MVVFPNAKINLGLNITARRPDGYHDICSLMVPTAWCDILEIVPAKGNGTTLSVTGRAVDCPPEKNLVMKAVHALNEVVEVPNVDIFLHKIIPDGAGLGGGSADAAFTLTALDKLFGFGLTQHELADIAATIGSDCPFFIYNRPMMATGTGTNLTPFDCDGLSGLTIAIVKPDIHISTAEAYAGITPCIPEMPLSDILMLPPHEWRRCLINDFEAPLASVHNAIGDIRDNMYAHGALYASLSGSGSAVYGLFVDDKMAERAAASQPGYASFVGKLTLF